MQLSTNKAALVLALSIGALFSAPAEALRCGHRLISVGDHESKMLRFCGQPLSVQSRAAPRIYVGEDGRRFIPGVLEYVRIEEWTYNFGPRKLMHRITVEDGLVAEIRQLGYGFLEK